MNLFGVLDISSSALVAERERAEVVASNLANADSTGPANGRPYQRESVVFAAQPLANGQDFGDSADLAARGVEVAGVVADTAPAIRQFDPSNPAADAQGYVSYPAINPVQEMADLMGAVRAYQFNVSAVQATKDMIQQTLQILS